MTRCIFLTVFSAVLACGLTATAQTPDAETSDVFPQLRQPGDDVVTPLSSPVNPPDESNTEALSHYMDGLAAQKKGQMREALESFRKAAAADPDSPEPFRAQATLLMRMGKPVQAEEAARKAIELDANDHETRFQLALLLIAKRNADDAAPALKLLDEALQSAKLNAHSPEAIQIHRIRGQLALQLRDGGKAVESYTVLFEALETPEDFGLDFRAHQSLIADKASGYQAVGTVMLEFGRAPQAIKAFEALVRINEDEPGDQHFLLALAQFRADKVELAEKNLNRYFKTRRRRKEALALLRDIYRATSRLDDFAEVLQALATDTRDSGTVNLFLGTHLLEQGQTEAAIKVYDQVIADTGEPDGYLGLVRVDILKRDADTLISRLQKAIRARIQYQELLPLSADILNDQDFATEVVNACVSQVKDQSNEVPSQISFFCSEIARQINLLEQEGLLLQATLNANPEQLIGLRALDRLPMNLLGREQFVEAAEGFRKILTIPDLNPRHRALVLYRLSFVESINDDFPAAVQAIQAAIQINPQDPEYVHQLASLQLQMNALDDAEESLKKAIELAEGIPPVQTRSQILLAGLYMRMERWEESIAGYNAVISAEDTDAESLHRARLGLSNAYVQMGDIAAGEKVLEQALQASPDDPGVNNDLGYLYADQNKNLEQAEKMIRIAVEAEPENPAYLDSLGWVLFRLGKHEEAATILQQATSDPDYQDATIIEHLGDVQQALGQQEKAIASWKNALKIEQDSTTPNPEVLQRLKQKLPETQPGDEK